MSRIAANPQDDRPSRRPATTEVDLSAPYTPPPAPPHLSALAAEVWADVWDGGRQAYHLKTDAAVIERYAEMTARRAHLLEVIEEEGWTTVGSTGQVVAHPAAKLLDAVDGKLTALEDRLGRNPEARIRLGIATVEKESKLSAFLQATEDPRTES